MWQCYSWIHACTNVRPLPAIAKSFLFINFTSRKSSGFPGLSLRFLENDSLQIRLYMYTQNTLLPIAYTIVDTQVTISKQISLFIGSLIFGIILYAALASLIGRSWLPSTSYLNDVDLIMSTMYVVSELFGKYF